MFVFAKIHIIRVIAKYFTLFVLSIGVKVTFFLPNIGVEVTLFLPNIGVEITLFLPNVRGCGGVSFDEWVGEMGGVSGGNGFFRCFVVVKIGCE